ncbi:MAG: hypothetical protein Q9220_003248 [cf. Caloplaca sp. 1 TL-2023]
MKIFTTTLVAAISFTSLALCDSAPNAAPAGLSRRDGSANTFIKRDAYYNATSNSIELSPRLLSEASLERRQNGLRLYWDSARRYRVLFRGNFANIAMYEAFARSTSNVAQGLASALKDYLVAHSLPNVDVWGHYTNIDNSDAGTLGVSVRDLGTGGFLVLRAAIQDFFEQHPDTHFVLQQCQNAFDLREFGFRNPPGNGPAARKRNAEDFGLSKRQVGGGASGPVSTDFCNAPIDNIWNMVDGPPTASYDFTEHC